MKTQTKEWTMPAWMHKYASMITNGAGNIVPNIELSMNKVLFSWDCSVEDYCVKARVELLQKLHDKKLI